MKTSEQINDLAAALAKAQGEIESAHKDSANPFFKSRYADLSSVWDACRVPLSKNGLAIVQLPRAEGATVTMVTRLLHASGQWIEGELTAVAKDDGPQSIGSIVTYLRRYMLQSLAGVAPDDDDANAAQGQEPRTKAQAVAKQHGMTTGDKVPAKPIFDDACALIGRIDSDEKFKLAEKWLLDRKTHFTERQWLDIAGKLAEVNLAVA